MSDVASLKDTIAPNSKQLNAEELLSAPMTITVTEVSRASGDQPVAVSFANDGGKPFMPCKTMRKILIFAWGDDGRQWVGKSMTLYCDPEVKFGGVKVGGIRISHMTDIESDMAVCLNTTKGKKGEFKIRKLASVRSKSALSELLTEAAKNGTQSLRSIWGKTLSEAERQSFGNACPEKIKQAAADVDSAVPKNLAQGSE